MTPPPAALPPTSLPPAALPEPARVAALLPATVIARDIVVHPFDGLTAFTAFNGSVMKRMVDAAGRTVSLRVEIDGRGLVVSAYDVAADREALAPGSAGNLLQVHPDVPNHWDAWDIDAFYRHRVTDLTEAESVVLTESSGAAATVEVTRSFGDSRAVQRLTLHAGAARLEIETEVDWHERERILKAAFPLDVKADHSAAETQFGHVFRPTHTNTSR